MADGMAPRRYGLTPSAPWSARGLAAAIVWFFATIFAAAIEIGRVRRGVHGARMRGFECRWRDIAKRRYCGPLPTSKLPFIMLPDVETLTFELCAGRCFQLLSIEWRQ